MMPHGEGPRLNCAICGSSRSASIPKAARTGAPCRRAGPID